MISKRATIYSVSSSLLLVCCTLAVSLINLKIYILALDVSTAGVWLMMIAVGVYISILDFGFGTTFGREISLRLGGTGDELSQREKITQLSRTVFRATVIISSVAFLILLPAGLVYFSGHITAISTKQLFYTWVVFLCGAVFNLVGAVNLHSLYGFGLVASERLVRTGAQLLWLMLNFLVLKFSLGILGFAVAWLVQGLAARTIAGIILYRKIGWLRTTSAAPSYSAFKGLLSPSLNWALTSFGAVLILQTSPFIIAETIGSAAVPQYEGVVKIASALMTFGVLIANAVAPQLSRAYAAQKTESFNRMTFSIVRAGLTIVLAGGVFASVLGDSLIEIWLGKDMFPGFPVLWFIVAMATLEVHHVILATITMASGVVPFAKWAIGAGILNIALGAMLAPKFGLAGVAAGTFAAQLITNNWFVPFYTLRRFQVELATYLKRAILPTVIPLSVFIIAARFLRQVWDKQAQTESTFLLVISAYLFICCLVIGLFLLACERRNGTVPVQV